MIRSKLSLMLWFLLFYTSSLLSQGQGQNPGIVDPTAKIIPQAPTTASLGSYAYAPVGLATGQQNLSVPIWELSGKTLSVPISMSYRPGVLLESVSEYTGHGWSLNAGGVITRTIKGNPDPKTRANYTGIPYTYPETWDILTEQKDPSPDVYNYNFNGKSGQFALKDDGTPYFIKDLHDWEIAMTNAKIEITTESGVKYVFEDIETTNVEDNYGNYWHNNVTVAWYLSEIISPNGKESIVFNYYTETIKTGQRLTNNSLKIREDVQATTYIADPSPWSDIIDTKRLSDITLYLDNTAISKATFDASTTPRTDLAAGTTAYVLSRINIFPNANSALPANYFDFNIVTVQDRRLFLNSIQEFSGDGTDSKPPYTFTYYNPSSLPSRYSYNSDHWGYYSANGAEFAALEKYSWLTGSNIDTKEPSFPEAQYGSLESVQFPTGGKNKYIYELNEYHKQDYEYQTVNLGLDWQGGNWKNASGNVSNVETTSFTMPSNQNLKVDLCLEFQKSASYSMATLQNEVPSYSITIDNAATGNNVFSADFMYNSEDEDYTDMYVTGKGVCHTSDHFQNVATSVGKCLYQLDLTLSTGTYNVTINTSTTTNNSMTSGEASIAFKYRTGNQINYKIPGNGIRLARQELRDGMIM